MNKVLMLAMAGAFGTVARYGMSTIVNSRTESDFPLGTLVVNIVGCFLAGLFVSLGEGRFHLSEETRAIILIGFMGAFTTFSAFILDTHSLAKDSEIPRALANFFLQNTVGFLMLFVGLRLGKVFFGAPA